MASDRFPYDLPSREALIQLINETHPSYELNTENTLFGVPYPSPTENAPGRTYIEADNTLKNVRMWFVYRRLDIARSLQGITNVSIEGAITPRKIVAEINRIRSMTFGPDDVNMSNIQLVPLGEAVMYRLKALPGSYVWYGETLVHALPYGNLIGVRLMEDGTPRLMEDGSMRMNEEGTQWLSAA